MGAADTTVIAARIVMGVVSVVLAAASVVVMAALALLLVVASFIFNRYCRVCRCTLPALYRWVSNQLFQAPTATNKATVATTGKIRGKIIRQNRYRSRAIDAGRLHQGVGQAEDIAAHDNHVEAGKHGGNDIDQKLRPSLRVFWMREMVGIRPALTYMVTTMATVITLRSTYSLRLSAKASMEVNTTLSTVCTTVRSNRDKEGVVDNLIGKNGLITLQTEHPGNKANVAAPVISAIVKGDRQGIEHRVKGNEHEQDHAQAVHIGKMERFLKPLRPGAELYYTWLILLTTRYLRQGAWR